MGMTTTLTEPHTDTSSKGMAKTITEQLEEAGCVVERQARLGESWLLWVVDESGRRFHVTVKGRRS
jgi:hypothetical protein